MESTDDSSTLDISQLSGTYWWGVPTLFRCELESDPSKADIALVGVPHSSGNGTTERDQHLGPRAVRDQSMGYRRFNSVLKLYPWDACRVRDMGDVPLPRAMHNDDTMKDIETWYKAIDKAGALPVSVGGDHSITLPILRAIAGPDSNIAGEPIAVVHFDAHHDSYGKEEAGASHMLGNYEWAGSWAKSMADEGLVDPAKVTQIGMRGHGYSAVDGFESERLGYRVIDMDEFQRIGIDETVREIRERVGNTPLYITFDLDVLDTTEAPGVSNLEPGFTGMSMIEAMRILHGLRGLKVIGADVVCLIPTKDSPNKITSLNASVIMFEQISLIADRLMKTE
jgi:guanidinopropionase